MNILSLFPTGKRNLRKNSLGTGRVHREAAFGQNRLQVQEENVEEISERSKGDRGFPQELGKEGSERMK